MVLPLVNNPFVGLPTGDDVSIVDVDDEFVSVPPKSPLATSSTLPRPANLSVSSGTFTTAVASNSSSDGAVDIESLKV